MAKIEISGISVADYLAKYKPTDSLSNEQMEALQREVVADIATMMREHGATEVVIQQYTPVFNDGEPCVHIISDPYINGYNMYGYNVAGDPLDSIENSGYYSPERTEFRDGRKELHNAIVGAEDALYRAFDTNTQITITRDGDTATYSSEYYDCGY